jgi:hypothetical protein
MNRRLSRREFLGLAGLTAGGLTCVGGILGYLLQRELSADRHGEQPAARLSVLKQIDRPVITTRAEWGAREPNHQAENESGFYNAESNVEGWRDYEGDLRAIYRTVVVHHSALYETDDLTTMQAIQNKHMDERKWADVAYHFGVGRSGQVFEGRDLAARGTHVERYNTGSVGVVFFGNFDEELVAPEQLGAGKQLINWLALRLELTHLAGHREFNDITTCPGTNLAYYLDELAVSAGLIHSTEGYQPPPEQLITPTPPL